MARCGWLVSVGVLAMLPAVVCAQNEPFSRDGSTFLDSPVGAASTFQVMRPMQVGEDDTNPDDDPGLDGAVLPDQANPMAILEENDAAVIPDSEHQWWRIRPSASFGTTFDDNIFISNTDRESDVIFGVQGGIALELGDFRNLQENFLIAQYTGTGYFYVRHPEQDAFNQDASLLGQYRLSRLTLQLESRYQYLTGSDRNVGNFADRSVIENTVRGIYDFSEKTSIDTEFFQGTYLYPQYLSQYNYRLKIGQNYQLTGRISLGLEQIAGVLDVQDSSLQYYQQLRLRARYEATGKLAFKFSGGAEIREFEDSARPVRISPVFSLGVEYKPFDGTTLGLEGYADTFGSTNFVGQNFLAVGLSATAEQRLFSKFFAGIAFSYENDGYYATENNVAASRTDNYIDIRPSLDYRPVDWMSAGVFYEYRMNNSTFSNYSFTDNRTGFEIGVQF